MTREPGTHPPNYGETYPAEPLTEDEVRALLAQCSLRAPTGIRNRALITVMYRAGLRISEAIGYVPRPGERKNKIEPLKVSDVDQAGGTIRVLHGKGNKARVVGLDDGAMEVLARWIETRRGLGITRGPLFCTLDGRRMSDRYVRNMLKRLAAKAGIEKRVHPHGLRHSHAAELAAEHVPVNTIQQQLGHESLATTDRYLKHIAPADVIAMGRNRKPWTET